MKKYKIKLTAIQNRHKLKSVTFEGGAMLFHEKYSKLKKEYPDATIRTDLL